MAEHDDLERMLIDTEGEAEENPNDLLDQVPGGRRVSQPDRAEEPASREEGGDPLPPTLADVAALRVAAVPQVQTPGPSLSGLDTSEVQSLMETTDDPNLKAKLEQVLGKQTPAPAQGQFSPNDDVTNWDVLALSKFDWLRDQSSEHFKKFLNELRILQANGYSGPDIKYRAANTVDDAPRRERIMDENRTRQAKQGNDFAPQRKPRDRSDSKLGDVPDLIRRKAAELNITSDEGMRALMDGLREAKRKVDNR